MTISRASKSCEGGGWASAVFYEDEISFAFLEEGTMTVDSVAEFLALLKSVRISGLKVVISKSVKYEYYALYMRGACDCAEEQFLCLGTEAGRYFSALANMREEIFSHGPSVMESFDLWQFPYDRREWDFRADSFGQLWIFRCGSFGWAYIRPFAQVLSAKKLRFVFLAENVFRARAKCTAMSHGAEKYILDHNEQRRSVREGYQRIVKFFRYLQDADSIDADSMLHVFSAREFFDPNSTSQGCMPTRQRILPQPPHGTQPPHVAIEKLFQISSDNKSTPIAKLDSLFGFSKDRVVSELRCVLCGIVSNTVIDVIAISIWDYELPGEDLGVIIDAAIKLTNAVVIFCGLQHISDCIYMSGPEAVSAVANGIEECSDARLYVDVFACATGKIEQVSSASTITGDTVLECFLTSALEGGQTPAIFRWLSSISMPQVSDSVLPADSAAQLPVAGPLVLAPKPSVPLALIPVIERDYAIIHARGDGNCLFNAFVMWLAVYGYNPISRKWPMLGEDMRLLCAVLLLLRPLLINGEMEAPGGAAESQNPERVVNDVSLVLTLAVGVADALKRKTSYDLMDVTLVAFLNQRDRAAEAGFTCGKATIDDAVSHLAPLLPVVQISDRARVLRLICDQLQRLGQALVRNALSNRTSISAPMINGILPWITAIGGCDVERAPAADILAKYVANHTAKDGVWGEIPDCIFIATTFRLVVVVYMHTSNNKVVIVAFNQAGEQIDPAPVINEKNKEVFIVENASQGSGHWNFRAPAPKGSPCAINKMWWVTDREFSGFS
ncbi:MAG: hypothetical protein LBD33_01740 [Puniceicoccales bacterium]|jgi:hypothetical protein|nr:hypothetical protein [Puniceicoccales bacterium]